MHGKNFIALVLALALMFLAGCTASGTPSGASGGAPEKSPADGAQNAAPAAPGEAAAEEITVHSAEELLEAIQPGAAICIAPGSYNLSDYLTALGVGIAYGENWNDRHDYVQIQDCYDGFELLIQNADGLSIRGGGETTADTEITVDPRYATVLNFENCSNLKLSNLTLGHTELGACVGNVLDFRACETIELRAMDLYGCGELGIECTDATDGLSVYDSTIRDCSSGPLSIYGCTGRFAFYDCVLSGSSGSGFYEKVGNSELSFHRCTFGEQETNGWHFNSDIIAEDCLWSEITSYPDYSGEDGSEDYGGYEEASQITFSPETMLETDLDKAAVEDTYWIGYQKVDTQTGESASLLEPFEEGILSTVSMFLNENGAGTLDGIFPDKTPVPFLWEPDSENPANITFLTLHHGSFYGTLYRTPEEDAYPPIWMSLQVENTLFWLY